MTDATKIEPIGWGQLGLLNGKTYLRENYNRCPYPPPSDVIRSLQLVPFYDQSAIDAAVLAAVAEERERNEKAFCEIHADYVREAAERDAEIERLRALVQDALRLCSGVAEQQAYPDDSWMAEAARINDAIKGAPNAN